MICASAKSLAMHPSILKLASVVVLSAFVAVAFMFRYAFRTGESPADDGPRALISEFCGLWVGSFLLLLSFAGGTQLFHWCLRAAAAVAALCGFWLSSHFADTTEVPQTPDKEPTGFKNNSTELHLE